MERIDAGTPTFLKSALKRLIPGVDRSIYKVVRRLTSDKKVKCKIRRGTLKGRVFECSLKNERDYWLGIWEPAIERFLVSHLQSGDIFYDVGVHKGYFSLIAATTVGPTGQVIGFEPNSTNREAATVNFALNSDLAGRIKLKPYAIMESSGTAKFTGEPNSTMGRVTRGIGSPDDYTVEAISINAFVALGNPAPSVVKMDIEGGERWALLGMIKTLSKLRPILVVEIHDAESYAVLTQVALQTACALTYLNGEQPQTEFCFGERSHYVLWP